MSALPDQCAGWAAPAGGRHYSLSIGRVQRFVLWLFVFCGCFALFEPSPYEVMFIVTLFVFMVTGLRINAKLLPMVVLLLLFNIGGIFSLIPFMDEPDSVRFIVVGVYLMFTAILFAVLLSDDAEGRLNTIRQGMIASAWLAASAGIIGYFNVGGLGEYLTLYNRASGTFKDPNVFGPFLVLPIVFVVQAILLKRIGLVAGILLMSVPVLGLFLSFSRGAWANLVGATLVLFALTFLTAPTAAQRSRIIGFAILIVTAAVMALLALLTVDGIREIFNERASLNQSYDMGVQGRFGNQIRSIGMLLEMPNGMGPLRFRFHFPEDPHNTYINAFASYGWLGGFSYAALVVVTMIAGWTMVWRRSTVQPYAIAIWSVLFITLLQGLQIDIDHWRNVYLQLGLVWGLRAITPEPARGAQV